MIFLTKEQLIENEWKSSYYHFNERLNERYDINITYKKYIELCKKSVKVLKKDAENTFIGLLIIHRNWVLVVKNRKTNKLVTALPFSNIYKII